MRLGGKLGNLESASNRGMCGGPGVPGALLRPGGGDPPLGGCSSLGVLALSPERLGLQRNLSHRC